MDRLSSSELLAVKSNSTETLSSRLSDYASDLLHHPGQHLPELGLLVAGIGVGAAVVARRFIAEAQLATKAAVSEAGSRTAKSAADTFVNMDRRSVENAVQMLKTRDGIEISSWGATHIDGSRGTGLSVLRASDLGALQIKRNADTVYAHKISIRDNGDTVAAYYTNSPMNLKNPWAPDEATVWPLFKGGPFDGLKQSGIQVMDLATKPRGLHFRPKLDSLSIRWTDLRAINETVSREAKLFSSIDIHGKDAVMKGKGQISLNPAK